MINDIERLLEDYRGWLSGRTELRRVGNLVEVTTPYLDRHNDCIQVYVKQSDGGYIITDGRETIDDLEMSGISMDNRSSRRIQLLETVVAGFDVKLTDGELMVPATADTFARSMHNLIQTILATDNLAYTANVASPGAQPFSNDVRGWVESTRLEFESNVSLEGKSGFASSFDYKIVRPSSPNAVYLHTLAEPSRNTARQLLFMWLDTLDVRAASEVVCAALNDQVRPVPLGVREALHNYDIQTFEWSNRNRFVEDFMR